MTDAEKKPREFDLYFVLDGVDGSISPYDSSICENRDAWKPDCNWAEPNAHVIEYSAFQEAQEKIKNLETFILESDKYALDLEEQVAKLEARVEKLRSALEFYGDGESMITLDLLDGDQEIEIFVPDDFETEAGPSRFGTFFGKRARAALKEDEEMG